MGCYIGVADRDGNELPAFRQDKWAGSRDLVSVVTSGKHQSLGDDFEMLRPDETEFSRVEAAVSEMDNAELFGEMVASLKENPAHWLKISY